MTEVPPFLFLVTSTALVLGAAITIRGLLGFRPAAEGGALPPPVTDDDPADTLLAQATSAGATMSIEGASDEQSASSTTTGARDMREPIVMTIAGALICLFTLLTISALMNVA